MKAISRPDPPLYLTRQQCRAVDDYAVAVLGVPSSLLMENAGRQAADLCIRRLQYHRRTAGVAKGAISIVCGRGNNGGDGFVMARHLLLRGCQVHVDLTADPAGLRGDAAMNFAVLERLGAAIRPLTDAKALRRALRRWRQSCCVVDALLGTGFQGPLREPMQAVIRAMNASQAPTLALDLPSGLDADTGMVDDIAPHALWTITFLARKVGFRLGVARKYLGHVAVADIGVPARWIVEQLSKRA